MSLSFITERKRREGNSSILRPVLSLAVVVFRVRFATTVAAAAATGLTPAVAAVAAATATGIAPAVAAATVLLAVLIAALVATVAVVAVVQTAAAGVEKVMSIVFFSFSLFLFLPLLLLLLLPAPLLHSLSLFALFAAAHFLPVGNGGRGREQVQ